MAKELKKADELSIWDDAQQMIEKARRDGVETAWDRYETQSPHCTFCELGLTCKNCNMGPCRISPKEGGKMQRERAGAAATVPEQAVDERGHAKGSQGAERAGEGGGEGGGVVHG